MSRLLEVLLAEQKSICRALAEKLVRAECPALIRTRYCKATPIYKTLCDACEADDDTPLEQWADALANDEKLQGTLPYDEVLAALHCVERVVRYYAVRGVDRKKALIPTLAELSDMIDTLRLCCLENTSFKSPEESNDLYRFVGLADGSNDYICLATPRGEPLYLNVAARRAVGLPQDAPLPPKSLHRCYSRHSWRQLREIVVPAVGRNGHWEGLMRLRNVRTGRGIDVQTTVFRITSPRDDDRSCLAIIHRELGDSDQAEAALAESQARKHAILESSLDPIITIDDEGVITEFNRAAEQAFGYPRNEVLGTKPSDVLFPPGKSAGQQNRIDRYLEAGEGSLLGRRTEVIAVRANGETFPAELAMTISQEQGAPVMTFFVRDISARKKAEQEQARYAADLKRSNRDLEEFAYVASHDLQEPLRKIRAFSDRLEMRCGQLLDETGRDCVERMQSAAGRMQLLIEGLLQLSRVTTRGQHFERIDLTGIVEDVVSDLEVQIEQAEGRVEIGKLPTIEADRLQMQQLFQNLIGNALKFRCEEEPPLVKVEARFVRGRTGREAGTRHPDEQCRITVKDNGIGFDEKYAHRIFDVFQRLHTRDAYEGTGIGLAICRKIAEAHGGSISAESKPGRGAAFEVLLPVFHPGKEGG